MWSPTHVQVTVERARGLLTKGKNGTNDAFVTIALGKEKFLTSVKEKSLQDVEWFEECELSIPKQGNVAEIVLTVYHRNFFIADEFLGFTSIPLADLDVYEKPKSRWFELKSKPGKEKNKPRGELEVKISFLVKAGSLMDLQKKQRSSLGRLSHMAQSVVRIGRKSEKDLHGTHQGHRPSFPMSSQILEDADHEILSEFTLEEVTKRSSGDSGNGTFLMTGSVGNLTSVSQLKLSSTNLEEADNEWNEKIFHKNEKDFSQTWETTNEDTLEERKSSSDSPPEEIVQNQETPEKEKVKEGSRFVRKLKQLRRDSKLADGIFWGSKTDISDKRIVVGGENPKLPAEALQKYEGKSKEALIEIILNLEMLMEHQTKRVKDLEDYLDNLLLRVMETTPRILQKPPTTRGKNGESTA